MYTPPQRCLGSTDEDETRVGQRWTLPIQQPLTRVYTDWALQPKTLTKLSTQTNLSPNLNPLTLTHASPPPTHLLEIQPHPRPLKVSTAGEGPRPGLGSGEGEGLANRRVGLEARHRQTRRILCAACGAPVGDWARRGGGHATYQTGFN